MLSTFERMTKLKIHKANNWSNIMGSSKSVVFVTKLIEANIKSIKCLLLISARTSCSIIARNL